MTARFQSIKTTLALLLTVWALGSCVEKLEVVPQEIDVSLALSLKSAVPSRSSETKMAPAITQLADGSFRGIEEVFVIPFKTVETGTGATEVVSTSDRLGIQNVELKNPGIINAFSDDAQGGTFTGLVNNNNSRLYPLATMPGMTNRVLVYGKAIDDGPVSTKAEKHHNGVLVPVNLNNPATAGDIAFSLEPVMENGELDVITGKVDDILASLNAIVSNIRSATDPQIITVLNAFTHEGQILACSYQTFYRIWSDIQTAVLNLPYNETSVASERSALSLLVNDLHDDISSIGQGFPASSYGIPEGTLGFWWNGSGFLRLIPGVNVAQVNPAYYCYPPSLWYYANSPIRTSDDDTVKSQYKSANAAWTDILSHYVNGTSVSPLTRSAAVVDQLQYGVGMLELGLGTPGTEALSSAADCPLTGIIIGDQKNVDFSFRPAPTSPTPNPGRYIYDNIINDDLRIETPAAGAPVKTMHTLVLHTAESQNVHFALEFQNNTGRTLHCQQGDILPGCRFYLAGELNLVSATQPGAETMASVFNQDHITRVIATIESLRAAYNTVPDLHDPQLEIGITADMK